MVSARAILACVLLAALAVPAEEAYALIAGSVFRPNGASMPSVEVTLSAEPDEQKGKKPKAQKQTSNFRGEFTFRVPAKPMRYTLSVRSSGYKPLTKAVLVAGDERQDVSLMLESGQ